MRLLPHIVLANLVPSGVLAWGAAGHEIVATIAQIHLHPSAYPTICSILNYTSPDPTKPLCQLAPVATWADRLRFRMRWSAPLHYVGAIGDHPSDKCLFPGPQGWEGKQDANVLSATRNVTNLLVDFMKRQKAGIKATTEDLDAANEALKFLIHFIGDLHQPLHLTGRDRGGNGDKVLFDGRQTNLHSVWDKFLIAKAIRVTPRKYDQPLSDKRVEHSLQGAIYDPYVRQIMAEGLLKTWKQEIPDWLGCPTPEKASPRDASVAVTGWQTALSLWQWLMRRDDPAEDTDDENLCPYSWAKPIHALNCEIVWPKELDQESHRKRLENEIDRPYYSVEDEMAFVDNEGSVVGSAAREGPELDTAEYAGAIAKKKLVERLLAQAGVRLAYVLNFLFAEDSMM